MTETVEQAILRPAPVVATTREELAEALGERPGPLALVPTMGALHAGHAALLRSAVALGGTTVTSIFVNPLQFAPGEDLDRYPRTLADDLALCAAEGVDVVFAPSADVVYPAGEPQVTVEPGPLAGTLEGGSRPTHFRGVLTVVAKLFGLVRPDVAFFGEKDYQQLVLIRRMSTDLCQGVDVRGVATVREGDGLALSSRNRFLDGEARLAAVALSRALTAAREAAGGGEATALAAASAVLRGTRGVDVDYVAVTDPELGPAPASGAARMLLAARVGGTRLIDNTALTLGAFVPGAVPETGDR